MTTDNDIYRLLQQHLDNQAVGFPSVKSGADIRLLQRLFTPEEARLALHLTYKPAPTAEFIARAAANFAAAQVLPLLESMFAKGAIGWKRKDNSDHWFSMAFVIGMYECQDGQPSAEFMADANAYMKTLSFGKTLLATSPSQMRTIPIKASISVEHHIATYDQAESVVGNSPGPFVVVPCICRNSKALQDKPCAKTTRKDTCLAFGSMAAGVLKRGHGREVSREEVLDILRKNEEDGLVLQPSNASDPEFICSCCGCCCGMLSFQKFLPRPLDFWTTSFHAEISLDNCVECGTCVSRCQVNALSMSGPGGKAQVDLKRCIGCGLCVPTCPSQALKLVQNEAAAVPPRDEEELLDRIMENKKTPAEQMQMMVKLALRMKQ